MSTNTNTSLHPAAYSEAIRHRYKPLTLYYFRNWLNCRWRVAHDVFPRHHRILANYNRDQFLALRRKDRANQAGEAEQ